MSISRFSCLILLLVLGPSTSLAGQSKLYWTDFLTDKIQRSNIDGSAVEDVLLIERPSRIRIDGDAGKMYWVSSYLGESLYRVHRAGADGSNLETIHEVETPVGGLALNLLAGKLYFTVRDCPGNSRVLRSDLDGANVEEIVTGQDQIGQIDLDVAGDRMLWYSGDECSIDDPNFSERIYRATLDGSGVAWFASGLASGLVLDTVQDVVYWVNAIDCVPCASFFRANYDGSEWETLLTDMYPAQGIDLDLLNDKMYFAAGEWVWRANLDGTGLIQLVDGLVAPAGLALDSGDAVPASSPVALLATILLLLVNGAVLARYRRSQPPAPRPPTPS